MHHSPRGKQDFLLDPKFPDRLTKSGYVPKVDFLKFLFKKYSQSGLTERSDRDVAIRGLIKRMQDVFKSEGRYGIFKCFLHRLLLWQRSDEVMPETVHKDYKDQELPSWSWMTFSGINFLSVPGRLRIAAIRFDTE
jgi:hypothetical protein